ncbi:MAG: putative membrane protein [Pelotomaculum thermopropionicum]|uniref:Putative membrane protein n=1 Tax=Pelotomaculum thermopropionicum TaxID=110500 RepID=A0A101HUN9_9FIRM|nr:MAG: putative membrane protein [Pelotomaculum thermopropionicum]
MLWKVIVGGIVLLLVILSVKERTRQLKYREKDWESIGETRSSPLSKALANLLGVAGGIYLSLMMVITFLEADLPKSVQVGGLSLEPLAVISIILALIHPYLQLVIDSWKKI